MSCSWVLWVLWVLTIKSEKYLDIKYLWHSKLSSAYYLSHRSPGELWYRNKVPSFERYMHSLFLHSEQLAFSGWIFIRGANVYAKGSHEIEGRTFNEEIWLYADWCLHLTSQNLICHIFLHNFRELQCTESVIQLMGMAVSYSILNEENLRTTKERVSVQLRNFDWFLIMNFDYFQCNIILVRLLCCSKYLCIINCKKLK